MLFHGPLLYADLHSKITVMNEWMNKWMNEWMNEWMRWLTTEKWIDSSRDWTYGPVGQSGKSSCCLTEWYCTVGNRYVEKACYQWCNSYNAVFLSFRAEILSGPVDLVVSKLESSLTMSSSEHSRATGNSWGVVALPYSHKCLVFWETFLVN